LRLFPIRVSAGNLANRRDELFGLFVQRIDRPLEFLEISGAVAVKHRIEASRQQRLARSGYLVAYGSQTSQRRCAFGVIAFGESAFDLLDAPVETFGLLSLLGK